MKENSRSTKKSKVIKKKPFPRASSINKKILNDILLECGKHSNLNVLDYYNGSILLVKKHEVEVRRMRNMDFSCMQPMEDHEKKTFFHLFMLYWDEKKIKKEHRSLEWNIGFPAVHVKSSYEAIEVIRNQ